MPHPGTITPLQLITHVYSYNTGSQLPANHLSSFSQSEHYTFCSAREAQGKSSTGPKISTVSLCSLKHLPSPSDEIVSQGLLYLYTCKKTTCYRSCNPCQTLVDDQNKKGHNRVFKMLKLDTIPYIWKKPEEWPPHLTHKQKHSHRLKNWWILNKMMCACVYVMKLAYSYISVSTLDSYEIGCHK